MLASNFLSQANSHEHEPHLFGNKVPQPICKRNRNSRHSRREASSLLGPASSRRTSSTNSSFERNEEACELLEQLHIRRGANAAAAAAGASESRSAPARAQSLLRSATRGLGCRLDRLRQRCRLVRLGALLDRLKPRTRRHRRRESRPPPTSSAAAAAAATAVRSGRRRRSESPSSACMHPLRPGSLEVTLHPCRDFATAASTAVATAVATADPGADGDCEREAAATATTAGAGATSADSREASCWLQAAASLRGDDRAASSAFDWSADLCQFGGVQHAATLSAADWTTSDDGNKKLPASAGRHEKVALLVTPSSPPTVARRFDHRRRLNRFGLSMSVGFPPVGLHQGWSVLVTALPSATSPSWARAQFDWSISGDPNSDYLVAANISAVSPTDGATLQQQQQQQQVTRRRQQWSIKLTKYSLSGEPAQFSPKSSTATTTTTSGGGGGCGGGGPGRSEARLLRSHSNTEIQCTGRLVGLFCTASYVIVAISQRDNVEVRVYSSDLWLITADWLMRNRSLAKEAVDGEDICHERIHCLTVDKAEQLVMYFHSYRVQSASKTLRRLCSLSLPDLQLSKRLPLKDDVKSIKVGTKYFALYFADNRLTVYCKTRRSPVFEFSAQKLSGLFLGDTFEMDSQDRLVEVSEQRIRSLFYNGVSYRDCSCTNLQELGKRSLIGRRTEFYEALQCHLATLRLTGGGQSGKINCNRKACKMRLRSNNKLLRDVEELLCRHAQVQPAAAAAAEAAAAPIFICEGAFWLEAAPEPGYRLPVGHHHGN